MIPNRPSLLQTIKQTSTPAVYAAVQNMCEQLLRSKEKFGLPVKLDGVFVGQAIHRRPYDKSNPTISLLMNYLQHGRDIHAYLMDFGQTHIIRYAAGSHGLVAENFGAYAIRSVVFSTDKEHLMGHAIRMRQELDNQFADVEMRFFTVNVANSFTRKVTTFHACELAWQAPELPQIQQFPI